jgi:phosphoribosylglycinamide formyltransferase-1
VKRVVVFFGKGGSNFLNILKHQKNYKVVLGITNRKDSQVFNYDNLPEILISNSNE